MARSEPTRIKRAKELRVNQTKAESLLWDLLRSSQLCGLKFRRQHPIGPYYADFACVSKRAVVELDGDYHDYVGEKDLERQKHLEDMGWKVMRFANDDVLKDVEAVTRAIAAHLGLNYSLVRRTPDRSGIKSSKSPTRSTPHNAGLPSRPSQWEGKVLLLSLGESREQRERRGGGP